MTIKVGDFRLARQLYSKGYYKLEHYDKVPIKWMALKSISSMKKLMWYVLPEHTHFKLYFIVGIWYHLLGGVHTVWNPILCFRI